MAFIEMDFASGGSSGGTITCTLRTMAASSAYAYGIQNYESTHPFKTLKVISVASGMTVSLGIGSTNYDPPALNTEYDITDSYVSIAVFGTVPAYTEGKQVVYELTY